MAKAIEARDFDAWLAEWVDRARGADLSPALQECASLLRRGFNRAFATEQGPDGAAWAPRKIDVGVLRGIFPADYARPLLVLSGDLISAASVRGAPGNINQVGAQELIVGVSGASVPYAMTHQVGATVYLPDVGHPITIPARPYLYATDETLDQIGEELADYLLDEVLK